MKKKLTPIYERLLRVRSESGLTSRQIEMLSSKSHGWWYGFKKNSAAPFNSSLCQVAANLGIDLNWIRTGKGPEPDWDAVRKDLRLRLEIGWRPLKNVVPLMRKMGRYVPPCTASILDKPGHIPKYIGPEVRPMKVAEAASDYGNNSVHAAIEALAQQLGIPVATVTQKVSELLRDKAETEGGPGGTTSKAAPGKDGGQP